MHNVLTYFIELLNSENIDLKKNLSSMIRNGKVSLGPHFKEWSSHFGPIIFLTCRTLLYPSHHHIQYIFLDLTMYNLCLIEFFLPFQLIKRTITGCVLFWLKSGNKLEKYNIVNKCSAFACFNVYNIVT